MIPIPNRLALKLIAAIGAALLLALLIHDRNHWKAKTAYYAELLAGERAAHAATVANYRAAAERARRLDGANATRVRAEQDKINEETEDAYQTRLADARARAGGLRRPATAAANPGDRGTAPVPRIPAPAERAAQAAGEDGLSLDAAEIDWRLTATEQAIQLDELIKWTRRQAAVEVNGKPGE